VERFLLCLHGVTADAARCGFGSVELAPSTCEEWEGMAFRLIVSELPDLTTMRLAGRLGDDAVAALNDACDHARRPLVLDLSQLTGASDAAVLLLRRLTGEGIHLLGASQYVTLLLTAEELPAIARGPSTKAPRRRKARPS
jgi:hypothetical protein